MYKPQNVTITCIKDLYLNGRFEVLCFKKNHNYECTIKLELDKDYLLTLETTDERGSKHTMDLKYFKRGFVCDDELFEFCYLL